MFIRLKEDGSFYTVIRILRWVAFVLTNVSLEQMLEAPGISPEGEEGGFFHERKKWTKESLKLFCGNLITFTEKHSLFDNFRNSIGEQIKSYFYRLQDFSRALT
jgi:hypothetical protein